MKSKIGQESFVYTFPATIRLQFSKFNQHVCDSIGVFGQLNMQSVLEWDLKEP